MLARAAVLLLLAIPASAGPITRWDPDEASRDADEELADIQRRIEAGDLPKIHFDNDSASLRESSHEVLDAIADILLRNPRLKLRITAHTSSVGTHDYNMKLSRERAKAVKDALVRRGIPPPGIRYVGRGPDEPIATNETEEGREKNRRVEFHLLKRGWSSVY